jgi:hypothetical protein
VSGVLGFNLIWRLIPILRLNPCLNNPMVQFVIKRYQITEVQFVFIPTNSQYLADLISENYELLNAVC